MWREASLVRPEARLFGSPCDLLSTCWLADFGHVDVCAWSAQRGEVGRQVLPQTAEGAAQPGEWQLGGSTMTARPVSEIAQQPEPQQLHPLVEQREQESVGEGGKPQQFLPRFSFVDARTLKGQCALLIFPTPFNLPASHIGKDDLPGLLIGLDGISSEQIPGRTTLTATDHQGQGLLRMVRVGHRKHEDGGDHPASTSRIPHPALRPAAFALRNLPGEASVACRIQQLIVLAPAQHEAQGVGKPQPQPERAGKPLIENMDHRAAPGGG